MSRDTGFNLMLFLTVPPEVKNDLVIIDGEEYSFIEESNNEMDIYLEPGECAVYEIVTEYTSADVVIAKLEKLRKFGEKHCNDKGGTYTAWVCGSYF